MNIYDPILADKGIGWVCLAAPYFWRCHFYRRPVFRDILCQNTGLNQGVLDVLVNRSQNSLCFLRRRLRLEHEVDCEMATACSGMQWPLHLTSVHQSLHFCDS